MVVAKWGVEYHKEGDQRMRPDWFQQQCMGCGRWDKGPERKMG